MLIANSTPLMLDVWFEGISLNKQQIEFHICIKLPALKEKAKQNRHHVKLDDFLIVLFGEKEMSFESVELGAIKNEFKIVINRKISRLVLN